MKNLPEEFELNDILDEFEWQKESTGPRSETFDFDSFLADDPVWIAPGEEAAEAAWVDFVPGEEPPKPTGESEGAAGRMGPEQTDPEPAEEEPEPGEEEPVLQAPPRPIVFVEPAGLYDEEEPANRGGRGWLVFLLGLLAVAAVAGLILLLVDSMREPLKEMLPEPLRQLLGSVF